MVHLQIGHLRQQRIGGALIAVQLEVGLASRLSDDQHHHCLFIIGNTPVGQFYLLGLFVLTETNDTPSVYHIRPRLEQSAQLGIVLSNPQRLINVQRGHRNNYQQRATTAHAQCFCLTYNHRLQHTINGRQNAINQYIQPHQQAKESRSLGVAGIEHVLDSCSINHHTVGIYKINGHCVNKRKHCQQHTSYLTHQVHRQISHHEVKHQHHDNQRYHQQLFATCLRVGVLSHIFKKREIVEQQRSDAYNARESKKRNGPT